MTDEEYKTAQDRDLFSLRNANKEKLNIKIGSGALTSVDNDITLFAKLNDIVSDKGAQLIIVYHPSLILNKDGTASANVDQELSEFFATCCEKNGIIFLYMSNQFLESYENESILPHGFTNTSIGTGHLNKNGHALIAESLYEIMKEVE